MMSDAFISSIFSIKSEEEFNRAAIELFRFQAVKCTVYSEYLKNLDIDRAAIRDYHNIPFIPVSFFRDHDVYCSELQPEATFFSSGTTGMIRSHHNIADLSIYEKSYTSGFNIFYGDPSQYAFMALLPSYADREGSSLVHMVKGLIGKSGNNYGGFFLEDYDSLLQAVSVARKNGLRPFLIGVTFALLDLAEYCTPDLGDVIIMETGGMKGRRKEIIREELHSILCRAFNSETIHSEYGMTELLSQAYSSGSGLFLSPPWMKVLMRDSHDPFSHTTDEETSGGISIIDLANIWSCAFIATSDLGRMHHDGIFEVLGRFDNSDIRGCNLLINA
jgi:hypothetical protein